MDKLKESIISQLSSRPNGCTTSDLARDLKVGRGTILIRLAELRSRDELNEIKVGSAKLLFLKKEG